jgi:GDPmannose 4,6-dehydratase
MWKNLNAKRDWGHAKDYVRGMWLMLQEEEPEDFVLATGETTTVRAFCEMDFSHLGITLRWEGQGINEKGIIESIDEEQYGASTSQQLNTSTLREGEAIVEVDPQYFRPTEVDILLGDAGRAKEKLGWNINYSVSELVKDMVESDYQEVKKINT